MQLGAIFFDCHFQKLSHFEIFYGFLSLIWLTISVLSTILTLICFEASTSGMFAYRQLYLLLGAKLPFSDLSNSL